MSPTGEIERSDDYLDVVLAWWKRSTVLKERFDLVELHRVAEQLGTGTSPVPYDDVLAQFRLSAQQGEFRFVGQRKVDQLIYMGPEIAKLLTAQELAQLTYDQLIADERLRLTPLEIETARCIGLMWASRPVLVDWLKKRKLAIPPWLATPANAAAVAPARKGVDQETINRAMLEHAKLSYPGKIVKRQLIDACRAVTDCEWAPAEKAYLDLPCQYKNPAHRPRKYSN